MSKILFQICLLLGKCAKQKPFLGNRMWRKNLALPEYEDAQNTADQLYIQDQIFFIKWYNCGSAPYFTVLQKEDTEFSRLHIPAMLDSSSTKPTRL